jgi:hypothetical protein
MNVLYFCSIKILKTTVMKTNLKLFGSALVLCVAMMACDKSSLSPLTDTKEPIVESPDDSSALTGPLTFGSTNIKPLTGSLTNLVSENFESGGRHYYGYQLKLEKLYPGHVVYPGGSEGSFNLSFSINFMFYSDQENGPVDEEYTIEFLSDPVLYYKATDKGYASDKKALAFIYGDRSFKPNLNGNEYIDYLKSQIRIKSGSLHIKKSGDLYMVSFEGETDTGEKVSCTFNDKISFIADNQFESQEEDISLTEIPDNYIQKGGKFYKLDTGYFFKFSPSIYQGKTIQTVQVIAMRDYYWYEFNYYMNEEFSGLINQHWKSNAMFLQFQFGGLNQFQAKTYDVAPSDGINSMGYGLGALRNIPFAGFPNDSHFIGYYHIATDTPFTFTYDEDPNYMKNQVALISGQLEITIHSSEYEFSGSFIDAQGEEVKVNFNAISYPWKFEW